MQRLLRGRMFYLVLTGFVLGLGAYGRTVHLQPWLAAPTADRKPSPSAEARWTEDVDLQVLRTAAADDPALHRLLFVLVFLTSGMLCAGVVLAMWSLLTGRIRRLWRGPFHPPLPWTFGEVVRITLMMFLVVPLLQFARVALVLLRPDWPMDPNLWINVSMLALYVLMLAMILFFAAGKSHPPLGAVGLSTAGWREAIRVGVQGYVALFPWLLLTLWGVVQVAQRFHLEPPIQPLQRMILAEERTVVLALTVLLACVIGPMAEEAFFRGVLFAALRRRVSRWSAMAVSGALFSAVHLNVVGFIPMWLLGCLLADLYERTGSLLSPIAIHVLHNTLLVSLALTYRWAM